MTLADLTQAYLALRNELAELDEKRKSLEVQRSALEAKIMASMDDTGVSSFNTTEALVYKSARMFASVIDMDALLSYCQEHDALHLLQRRVSTEALREWIDNNPDAVVDGIQVGVKSTISVRRK